MNLPSVLFVFSALALTLLSTLSLTLLSTLSLSLSHTLSLYRILSNVVSSVGVLHQAFQADFSRKPSSESISLGLELA